MLSPLLGVLVVDDLIELSNNLICVGEREYSVGGLLVILVGGRYEKIIFQALFNVIPTSPEAEMKTQAGQGSQSSHSTTCIRKEHEPTAYVYPVPNPKL